MIGSPRILMCPPDFYGIEYEINPWMNRLIGADPVLAQSQWLGLRRSLEELGVRIEIVEPVKGLPDLVFTANAGLVYRNLFIPSKFRYGVRQGEAPHYTAWAEKHGFAIVDIPGHACFEGAGDALFLGETLFAGYRFRSDALGHQWIGQRLGVEVLPLELADSRYYHLDTCFCPLSASEAIFFPGAFDPYGLQVLKARVPHLIEVNADEAASFSCNAVVVGRTVLLNDGAHQLGKSLKDRGYRVIPLPLSEFIKAGGSAKCLTLRLDGEEAAAWRGMPT